MTTEGNFFVRQDVTGFFTMLQGDRARGGVGIRAPARGGCEFFWVRWEIFYLFAVFSPFG
ncbi:hypothetical protein BUTYVIB_01907 [Eshraghiella crossota DSM 2876]|uniref:Uncharacterized protein n=1 Tax=Eshraghiella crossota DSM 2876 TaxID=511680 RepID=D4S1D7_9FIRM|nr:hypothetical protein BUTYVIB_01907 [Butyrivibrio crossotus DSM 2876]